MYLTAFLDGLSTVCKRVGPGRLPGADRPALGAGYAGASAAVVAVAVFAVVAAGLDAAGSSVTVADPAFVVFAVYAVPFVVPVAFVAATLCWRVLPAETPQFGAVAGTLAVLLTYLGATVLLLVFLTVTAAASLSGADPTVAPLFGLLVGVAAFVWTAWLAVPVGCLGGAIYERAGAGV